MSNRNTIEVTLVCLMKYKAKESFYKRRRIKQVERFLISYSAVENQIQYLKPKS